LGARELAEMTVPRFTQLRTLFEYLRFPRIVTIRDVPEAPDVRTLTKLGAQGVWLQQATPDAVGRLRDALEKMPREKGETPSVGTLAGAAGAPGTPPSPE
jgi:hypothetical protein